MPTQRLEPSKRKAEILAAAVTLAQTGGFANLTREAVAAKAKCSIGLVTLRFVTMSNLKRAVMAYAVKNDVLEIIAQGLMQKDPAALRVSERIKKAAVATVIG